MQMLFDIPEFREPIRVSSSSDIPIRQLRRIFTQLNEVEVANAYKGKNVKTLDIQNFLKDLKPWIDECKKKQSDFQIVFPERTGQKHNQEDAAEFLRNCVYNLLAETPFVASFEMIAKRRSNYTNKTKAPFEKAEPDILSILPIYTYMYRENESISTLIDEYFNQRRLNLNAVPPVNLTERIILQTKPNYMIFSMNRTVYPSIYKTIKNIKLENSVPIQGEQYNLYSVVVHLGASIKSGHYFYLFKETPNSWIEFNDDNISRISNDYFLNKYQANVAIVVYKKASEERQFPQLPFIRDFAAMEAREEAAKAEANAQAKAKAEANAQAKAKAKAQAKAKAKTPLSFLIGKPVFEHDEENDKYVKYSIYSLMIENNTLIGIRVERDGYVFPKDEDDAYPLENYVFSFDMLDPAEADEYINFPKEDDFQFMEMKNFKNKVGGRRTRKARKVDARKRKNTRKA